MNINIVNDGSFDNIISEYNIKTVEELEVYAKVCKKLNRPVDPMILSAIARAKLLEGYYPKNIENLKVNIDKFNSIRVLPLNFKLRTFDFVSQNFPTIYELKNADFIRGIGTTKKEYLDAAVKMYQDRVDTLLFTTPEKNLNLDILNNNQSEKLDIVNASSMVEDLLNNYENFIWGPMNGKTPATEEFKNMIASYIAMYNDIGDLQNCIAGIDARPIEKFIRK